MVFMSSHVSRFFDGSRKRYAGWKEGITKARGKFQDYQGVKVMPTFHPAYLLRDPSKKRETWEDMKTIRDYLAKSKSEKSRDHL